MNAVILSYQLDTNGGDARFVRASEKWGTDPSVLKALAIGDYDPASVVGRFAAAAEKYDELRIRSVHRSEHMYQSMPGDIVWLAKDEPMIRRLAHEADIIHLNNSYRPYQKLKMGYRKPMLLHHHGSLLRSPGRQHAESPSWNKDLLQWAYQHHVLQAVSTVDLMRIAPEELHWLPTAYDVDWLQAFGKEHRREPDDVIRVISAPTNRSVKSTDALEAAVAKLQRDGLNVELIVIEFKPWAECMALKATADIYFDQVILGYGCNAVEAWGMGIPVIAGADEWTLKKMKEVYGTDKLPFYEATEETIGEAIADLATHKAKRTQYARRGLAHVRKFHDELPALTRLAALYREAIDTQTDTTRLDTIPPVTFHADVPQLRIANRLIGFPFTTDNPNMARQVRLYALRRPRYGISEVA